MWVTWRTVIREWVDVDLRMGFGWENLPGKTELQNGNAKSHPWNLEFDVVFDFCC